MASKSASSARFVGCSSARSSCSASSAIRRTRCGPRLPDQRSRARVAAVVLPVEQHSRRRAARRSPSAASCGTPAVLTQQVTRMLAGPALRRAVDNFAGQWLFLRNVPGAGPVQSCSRTSTTTCARRSGARPSSSSRAWCARTAVRSICCAPTTRSSTSGWRGTTAFRNIKGQPLPARRRRGRTSARRHPRTGQHPDADVVSGSHVAGRARQVDAGEYSRHAAAAAAARRRRPEDRPTGSGAVLSMRERLAQHRANPLCASCHSMLDPIGLALENFDAVGKWRTRDESGQPIDASRRCCPTAPSSRPARCATALLARSDGSS